METEININSRRHTKDLLITIIIANPFIMFLLFKDLVFVTVLFLGVFGLIISLNKINNKQWIRVFVINILVLISIYLNFEVMFRYAFPEYIIEDLYKIKNGYYFNEPMLNKVLEDKEFKVDYKTNVQGYRIAKIMNEYKRVEKCDWLVIGDSYTQGAQVEFEELYSTNLANYFPDRIIINAGISGYGLPEELNVIKDKIQELHPSMILLQLCVFNDFMNVEENKPGITEYFMNYSDLARTILYGFKYKQPGELPLGRWTEPFYNNEMDNIDYNIFYKQKSHKKQKDMLNFKEYLFKISAICKENKIELIVFLIPSKEQLYYKYFMEVIDEFNIDIDELDMRAPNNFLKDICIEYNIKFLDLTEQYLNAVSQVFFEYDEHLNSVGHMETAIGLKKYLNHLGIITNSKILSNIISGDRYPTFFNKDSEILFQSYRHNSIEIFTSDSQLKNQRRMTFNDVNESHPDINPSKNIIVFTEGDQDKHTTNVVLLNHKTGVREYITKGENEYGGIPKFFNEGKNIVYVSWEIDNDSQMFTGTQIKTYDIETKENKVYISNSYENWRPIISKDGKKLIYISKRDDNYDLYLYNLQDKSELQLTKTSYDEWDPNFNDNCTKIIYAAYQNDNWDLFELKLNDFQIKQLTNTLGNEWDPSYSANGEIIYAGEFGFIDGIYKQRN